MHYGRSSSAERETIFDVPVTNALRTIIDVWRDEILPKPLLTAAFREHFVAAR